MKEDPIVTEVRQARQEHAARYDYDLRAIYAALKEQEKLSPLAKASFPAKRVRFWKDDFAAARAPVQVLREEADDTYGRPSGQDQDQPSDSG
jgi:hypothetical protein